MTVVYVCASELHSTGSTTVGCNSYYGVPKPLLPAQFTNQVLHLLEALTVDCCRAALTTVEIIGQRIRKSSQRRASDRRLVKPSFAADEAGKL
jgi:hypothetical protein